MTLGSPQRSDSTKLRTLNEFGQKYDGGWDK